VPVQTERDDRGGWEEGRVKIARYKVVGLQAKVMTETAQAVITRARELVVALTLDVPCPEFQALEIAIIDLDREEARR
jgi:hypothetical protein